MKEAKQKYETESKMYQKWNERRDFLLTLTPSKCCSLFGDAHIIERRLHDQAKEARKEKEEEEEEDDEEEEEEESSFSRERWSGVDHYEHG